MISATIDVKKNIFSLCINKYDTQIALVENQGVFESGQESVVRIYDVGRRRDDEDEQVRFYKLSTSKIQIIMFYFYFRKKMMMMIWITPKMGLDPDLNLTKVCILKLLNLAILLPLNLSFV